MQNENSSTQAGGFKPASTTFVVLILICLAVTWFQQGRAPQPPARDADSTSTNQATDTDRPGPQSKKRGDSVRIPHEEEPSLPEFDREVPDNGETVSTPVGDSERSAHPRKNSLLIQDQTIRNLDGKVVYRGTIDLTPTLDRISHGKANHHRNDGTTFQNREGRLPRQSAGYYREYVHPTPGESGPGPQRVIMGRDGDIWYTPDHYKTFHEIKSTPTARDEAN